MVTERSEEVVPTNEDELGLIDQSGTQAILDGVPVKEAIGVTMGNPNGITKLNFDCSDVEAARREFNDTFPKIGSVLVSPFLEVDGKVLSAKDLVMADPPDVVADAPIPPDSAGQPKTMSSLDIAEVTGKDHANVLKDIRRILDQAGIDALKFERVYLGGNGQERPCYQLPRFECDLVVSGYSVKYRLAIIDRWQELEARAAVRTPALPQDVGEAFQLAADLWKQNSAPPQQLQITAKGASFYRPLLRGVFKR